MQRLMNIQVTVNTEWLLALWACICLKKGKQNNFHCYSQLYRLICIEDKFARSFAAHYVHLWSKHTYISSTTIILSQIDPDSPAGITDKL